MIAILKRKPEPANDGPDWRTAREAVEQSERDQLLELFEEPCSFIGSPGELGMFTWRPNGQQPEPPARWMQPKAPAAPSAQRELL